MPSIRRAYEAVLVRGNCPGIATHDKRLIDAVKAHTAERGIGKERFEFGHPEPTANRHPKPIKQAVCPEPSRRAFAPKALCRVSLHVSCAVSERGGLRDDSDVF